MDVDNSSPETSRRPSRSQQTLVVRLRLPPRLLALASSSDSLQVPNDKNPVSSPFPLSSPPTIASSPAPAAPPKKRGGPKRKPGPAPGASVFPVNDGNGGGSAAGTPGPTAEKERAKPGPKANPGGINAGLRALDRSGKPVRRWQKVPFAVQTVSGYSFYTKTWISSGTFTVGR